MGKILRLGSRILVFALFFVGFCIQSTAQVQQPKSEFWQKVRFGGGFGLGFGNDSFNASLSPSAIYQATDQFAIGTGLNFNYFKYREDKLIAYGAGIMSFYNIIREIQLSAEFEQLRINRSNLYFEDDYWSPALFFGIGYTDRNFTIGVRYDVLYDENKSIYSNAWMPFVRVFF